MKSEKYYVKKDVQINNRSGNSNIYKFRIALFDNVDPEEILLFQQKYKLSLDAYGTLTECSKIQYLHTLSCGESLSESESLCVPIGNTNIKNLNQIILGLGT